MIHRNKRGWLAVLITVALVVMPLASATATAPHMLKVNSVVNDYPEDPDEPDARFRGMAKEGVGGWLTWNLLLSHEGEKFRLPKGEKIPKFFKEAWLELDIACINFFEEPDGSPSAVAAVQIVDSGWIDPELFGGFPQLFRDSWSVIKFVDGGPNGVGDWFREGRGDLDPTVQPPAPPFTEGRARSFCETGETLADGEEPCWGGPDNPAETVTVDGVVYGPWPGEEVCESWRTTDTIRLDESGNGFIVDGDIRIK